MLDNARVIASREYDRCQRWQAAELRRIVLGGNGGYAHIAIDQRFH